MCVTQSGKWKKSKLFVKRILSLFNSRYVQNIPVHPSFVVRHQFGYCLHCFLHLLFVSLPSNVFTTPLFLVSLFVREYRDICYSVRTVFLDTQTETFSGQKRKYHSERKKCEREWRERRSFHIQNASLSTTSEWICFYNY